MKTYLFITIIFIYVYGVKTESIGSLIALLNVTNALTNTTTEAVNFFTSIKEKKGKQELTKDIKSFITSIKYLTYSKEISANISFGGRRIKSILDKLDGGVQGLPGTEDIISQVCGKNPDRQKEFSVDPNFKGNFYAAIEHCSRKDMALVAVETKDQLHQVRSYLEKFSDNKPGRFWSSGSKLGNGKDWVWLTTGKKIKDLNWGDGEPNDSGGKQNCMELYVNYFKSGIYDDVECHYDFPAVCETC